MSIDKSTRLALLFCSALLVQLGPISNVLASKPTKHIIQFDFTFYDPQFSTVAVGDTIEWQGAFPAHPLVTDTVPKDAAIFDMASGNVLDYIVTEPGAYAWHCEQHGATGSGMWGDFFATANSGVDLAPTSSALFDLKQSTPNPFRGSTEISFHLTQPGMTQLNIYDERGGLVTTLLDAKMSIGDHVVQFDGSRLPSGVYFYELEAGGSKMKRQMVLQK